MQAITQEDIQVLETQQENAKDKVAVRWSQLAERMDDMTRLLTGDFKDEEKDSELVGMCIETCWAQCAIFYADMQLQAARESLLDESS
jgi:hypothetical protein